MLSLASRMLDRKDHDLVEGIVDQVVDEIGVATCYELPDALGFLRPSNMRKAHKSPERFDNGRLHPQCCLRVSLTDMVGDGIEILCRPASEARLSIEATRRRFDLGITGKFATFGLSETFQDGGKVFSVDLFGLAFAAQRKHGERDFILIVWRQAPHGFKSLLQELRHIYKIVAFPCKMNTAWNGDTR